MTTFMFFNFCLDSISQLVWVGILCLHCYKDTYKSVKMPLNDPLYFHVHWLQISLRRQKRDYWAIYGRDLPLWENIQPPFFLLFFEEILFQIYWNSLFFGCLKDIAHSFKPSLKRRSKVNEVVLIWWRGLKKKSKMKVIKLFVQSNTNMNTRSTSIEK